ncbi:MAG: tetratricopeptide repeat protein [Flavobacteriaceae bacterium]
MKKQVLAIAMLGLTSVAFAQKNEVKALEKAVKSEKYADAKALIAVAETVMSNADDKTKAKYYYLKAKAMLNGNDYEGISESLAEFEAHKSSKYEVEISQLKGEITSKLVNEAIADQGAGKQKESAKKLHAAYKLSGDQEYLYHAANSYVVSKDYKSALPLFNELKDKGYTGVKKKFYAYNKETKQEEVFSDKAMRLLAVKSGTHINPTEKLSASVLPDIIKNVAFMNVELGNTEAAITAIKEARATEPTNVDLILTEANLYLKLGEKDKFKALMQEAIKQDPNNGTLFFNLGVISAEQGDNESAREYYQKSLELNPEDINTNFNMAALILKEETVVVDQMNSLGTSSADNKKYDELQEKRNSIYKLAVPYLEKVLTIDAKNESAAQTLKNMYSVLGETEKFKAMKALLESL